MVVHDINDEHLGLLRRYHFDLNGRIARLAADGALTPEIATGELDEYRRYTRVLDLPPRATEIMEMTLGKAIAGDPMTLASLAAMHESGSLLKTQDENAADLRDAIAAAAKLY